MELKVGSYVKFNHDGYKSEDAFGFIYEILYTENERRYRVMWLGKHEGIKTAPGREHNYVLLANPSRLTNLLFF